MNFINILDKSIAELIAAGEVIERPASVVKELVENSIDAGSNKITVEIKNGGVTYIRISDNGVGIYKNDVKKAFLRHATSKVKNVKDLDNILTLGFRGEALAAICAVSKVELITKTKEEFNGTKYIISANIEELISDMGAPVGTTIIVKDLFFNVPARMKFLKKDVAEGNAIALIIDKLALSHPEISFTFIREGQEKLSTVGDGNLLSAIYCVLGKEVANKMLLLDYSKNNIKINGYIINPAESRMSRSMQNFFVNNRYVKSKTCCAALEEAYKPFIVSSRFPACVLNINIPANVVDINVHPAKLEIRFADEKMIYSLIYASVKNCILSNARSPVMTLKENELQTKKISSDNFYNKENNFKEKLDKLVYNSLTRVNNCNDDYKTNDQKLKSSNYRLKSDPNINVMDIKNFKVVVSEISKTRQKVNDIKSNCKELSLKTDEINKKSKIDDCGLESFSKVKSKNIFIGEVFDTYIIVEKDCEVIFIDKHAAHERLIYEKIKNGKIKGDRQILLNPEVINLDLIGYQSLLDNKYIFDDMGFLIEDFGDKTIIVREIPVILTNMNVLHIIEEIVSNIVDNKNNIDSKIIDKIYYNFACKAAIKAGDKNSELELKELIDLLEDNIDLKNCPHGRPISFIIKKKDIEKQFLR